MIFVIQYDRGTGHIEVMKNFADSREAESFRLALETASLRVHGGVDDREIVTLEAETEGALRQTHGRYFEDIQELALSPS